MKPGSNDRNLAKGLWGIFGTSGSNNGPYDKIQKGGSDPSSSNSTKKKSLLGNPDDNKTYGSLKK